MKKMRLAALSLTCLAAGAALLSGCIERKETIRVARDGGVEWTVSYKGDKADFGVGDALPDRKAGWDVELKPELDEQGNETDKLELRGALRVKAGEPLPDSFAPPSDPLHTMALLFPTEVTVDKRPDGVYYNFKRTYKGRAFANIEYYRKELSKQYNLEELGKKSNEELTDDERNQMLRGLIQIEGAKQVEFLRLAIDSLPKRGVKWPQYVGLVARQALIDRYDSFDLKELSDLIGATQSEERDQKIAELAGKFNQETHELLSRRLQELHLPQKEVAVLMDAIHDEETLRAITEDLGDEKFEISVEMPGEVVASNANKTEEHTLTWEFDAEALMDRDVELMATTRVAHATKPVAGAEGE